MDHLTFNIYRQKFHYAATIIGLFFLLVGLCSANFMISIGSGILGVNWLIEGGWERKWQIIKTDRHLWALLILYFVFIIGQIPASFSDKGIGMLNTKLPMLYMPLVMATTRIKFHHIRNLVEFYAYMVAFTTLLAWYNLLFNHLDTRHLYPFCWHISYGIQICVCSIICFSLRWKNVYKSRKHNLILTITGFYLIVCMVAFGKYTALAAGSITFITWLLYYVYRNCSKTLRWAVPVIILALLSTAGGLLYSTAHRYFTPRFKYEKEHRLTTMHGNPYTFDTTSTVENGQYIGVYVCIPEMEQAWNERSQQNFKKAYSTLVRYLNSKGDFKDYEAVMSLSDNEIQDVENGIANVKYHSPLARFYITLYELSDKQYVEGKSFIFRIYCWKLACKLIANHPLFGYGCGTAKKVFMEEQLKNKYISEPLPVPHQQYLEDAMTFGIPIAMLILAVYIYLIRRGIKTKNPILSLSMFMLMLTLCVEGNNYQFASALFAVVTSVFSYYNITDKAEESTENNSYESTDKTSE
ncbi:MAG: O-antigen ligase family protein [Salinivirgaceae bacterium]|nr:O-antigen ligase family protein [Salinivirgaceae bacterium]